MGTKGEKAAYSVQMDNFSSTARLSDDPAFRKSEEALGQGDYDPFAHRKVAHPNSDLGALAHLLKSSLGSGILAMPLAFKNGGLAFGMVGTIVVGIICTHCVQMLVHCSHVLCKRVRTPFLSFAETAETAFKSGPAKIQRFSGFARNSINSGLLLAYCGGNTIYVVLIARSIEQVVDYYYKDFDADIRIYILMLWVPLMILCLVRDLNYLVPFSVLANLFIVASFAITLYYMFQDLPDPDERELIANYYQMPLFFSTVIFAMEGIGVVMPVENSMKNPNHFLGCPGILNIAMGVVVTLYAVIGFFGYLKYGNATEGSVTLNLPVDEVLAQVVKILIALAIFFTYALQFYVPTSIIWEMIKNKFSPKRETLYNYIMRMLIVTGTVCLAIAVPNLGPIIGLVGAVCFSILGLLLPAIIDIVTFWEIGFGCLKWRLVKDIIIIVIAIFALLSGTYTSIVDIIEAY